MLRVNEIFTSIQGEGFYVGRAASFIRLAGCNCNCQWCDTDFEKYTEMSDEEIISQISHHSLVVITGGEPMLQLKELCSLVKKLQALHHEVAVETNGSIKFDYAIFDWVTLSPKNDVAGGKPCLMTSCDELKVVYEGQDLDKYENIRAVFRFLQPQYNNKQSLQLCIDKIIGQSSAYPRSDWRLSLQTHKLIGVR